MKLSFADGKLLIFKKFYVNFSEYLGSAYLMLMRNCYYKPGLYCGQLYVPVFQLLYAYCVFVFAIYAVIIFRQIKRTDQQTSLNLWELLNDEQGRQLVSDLATSRSFDGKSGSAGNVIFG